MGTGPAGPTDQFQSSLSYDKSANFPLQKAMDACTAKIMRAKQARVNWRVILSFFFWINEWRNIFNNNLDLRKREDLRNSLVLLGVTVLWDVAQWVSRAPQNHTLPAFWNLNGRNRNQNDFPLYFSIFLQVADITSMQKLWRKIWNGLS